MKPTNLQEFVADLNGGTFLEQIETVLSHVALAVATTGKAGEVAISFKMKPINNGNQLNITHQVKYVQPKDRGNLSEVDIADTAMYVNAGGEMTFFPKNQSQLFGKKGEIFNHQNHNQEQE